MSTRDISVVFKQDMGKSIEFGTKETDKWNVKHDDTLTIKEDGSLSVVPQQGGGLDCAAIGALPKREWKKGTTILAKQGNECVQLSALDSIFQEVGVGITANKTNGLTGETYHVVVTVTNTGEGTNDRTNLTITKPALGNYTTRNFTTSKSGANIARTDDWNYVITGLTRGGTAKVEFDVIPNGVGTFQFGASVNPNSSLDQQSNNNRATITLSATTNTAPNYVPSVDCPFITAKHGQRDLLVSVDKTGIPYHINASNTDRVNVIDQTSLRGVVLSIKGGKTVVVRGANSLRGAGGYSFHNAVFSNGKIVPATDRPLGENFVEATANSNHASNVNGYTFNEQTGEFRVTDDYTHLLIYVRAGVNCKWQCIRLATAFTFPKKLTLSTTAPNKQITTVMSGSVFETRDAVHSWSLPWSGVTPVKKQGYQMQDLTTNDTMVIRLRAGQHSTFTVTASGDGIRDYFANASSKGAIQISPASDKNVLNVTVTSSVSAADALRYNAVVFEVV